MEHDELAHHLQSLQREECYRVDAVLKQSPAEETQRVYFVGANGAERGPYIRKFIKREAGIGSEYERIFAAQQLGRRFKHVPDVLECYARDDELVVVMEFVKGDTLQEVVYQRDPSLELAKSVFPRLCDAVTELHCDFDAPIIHRDLKPSNIVLSDNGLALIDFGISREYREGAESDTTHFGTRGFAPPEQYGFGQTTVRSDVYSLGMVLFFCLTEEIPTAEIRNRAFHDPRVPEPVRRVIAQAAELDPAERFSDAASLKAAFLQAADGEHAVSSSAADAKANRPAKGKRRIAVAAIAAVIVCIVAVLAIGMGAANTASSEGGGQSDAQTTSTEATGGSDVDSLESVPASAVVADMQTPGEPKNGFDPASNLTVEISGVEFQIPRYFAVMTNQSEDGTATYYFAERGSSVAMLMAKETKLDLEGVEYDFEEQKDSYLDAFMKSDDLYEEILSSTDYELAGHSARVVTISGSTQGLSVTMKMAFFIDKASDTVGLIAFAQTNNVQFDYSSDFAKVITSAKPVE